MYTIGETKKRQAQAITKSNVNSQKSVNNMQKTANTKPTMVKTTIRLTASKNKVIEYGVNSRNQQQTKSKYVIPPIDNNPTPVATKFIRRPSNEISKNKSVEPIKKSTSISSTKTISYVRGKTYNPELPYKKSGNPKGIDLNQNTAAIRVVEPLIETMEMAIQTNEGEILNHALIVGDLKIMQPSKFVIDEIEQRRKDLETKKLLMTTRKFEEHSKMEEEHLDDLQEFLDKSYITRKPRKVRNMSLEEDRK